jgi:hypothetical protein
MRSGRPARPWAATSSPSPERPVTVRRCRCGGPPGARRSGHHRRPTPAPRARGRSPRPLRGRLRSLTTARLVATCGRLRQQAAWDVETATTAASLRALARRIQLLDTEVADHTRAITTLVRAWRPELLTPCGVGPIVAAIVLCTWSTLAAAERCRLRHAGWRRADPGLQRPDGAGAAESIRGPPAQSGPAPDRLDPAAL